MSTPTKKLKRRQELALSVLLTGGSDAEAAKAAGCRRETVCRWRHGDPVFIAAYNRRRQELWRSSEDGLRSLLPDAIDAVRDCLKATSPTTRLRAASLLLRTIAITDSERSSLAPPVTAPTDADAVELGWEKQAQLEDERRAFVANLGLVP